MPPTTLKIEALAAPLDIEVPDAGIVVFRGRNGTGKSRLIDVVDRLTGGKTAVSVNDGHARGRAEGFGCTLTVSRTATRRGKLTVDSLSGRFDIGEIIEPPIKDPTAADAKRIKTLIGLSGVDPDPSLFHHLLGGLDQFAAVCPDPKGNNLVEIAAKVKRACETHARHHADQVNRAEIRIEQIRDQQRQLGTPREIDEKQAYAELQAATEQMGVLTERSDESARVTDTATRARAALAAARDSYTGPTPDEATVAFTIAVDTCDRHTAEIEKLLEELKEARTNLRFAESQRDAAKERLDAAEHYAATTAEWEAQINQEAITPPTAEEITEVTNAVAAAKATVEAIPAQREHARLETELQAARENLLENQRRDQFLRDAAQATDNVLSDALQRLNTPLRPEAGRLVLDTDRGPTLFSELSFGERTRIACDILTTLSDERSIFPLRQRFWEGLDPINRGQFNEAVLAAGALVVTAEATADEVVTAQIYGAGRKKQPDTITITVTQFLRPEGRKAEMQTQIPAQYAMLYEDMLRSDARLHAELTATGEVYLTINRQGTDLLERRVQNGPDVLSAIYELLTETPWTLEEKE